MSNAGKCQCGRKLHAKGRCRSCYGKWYRQNTGRAKPAAPPPGDGKVVKAEAVRHAIASYREAESLYRLSVSQEARKNWRGKMNSALETLRRLDPSSIDQLKVRQAT
jgi:hypothetical protein